MKKLFILLAFVSFSMNAQNNETTKTKSFEEMIAPYIEKTLSTIDKGVGYIAEEVPEVIMQYVMFEAITHWIMVFVSILMIISSWLGGRAVHRKVKDDHYNNGSQYFVWVISYALSFFVFFCWTFDAIKVTWFPKLYLVEKFMDLI